MTRPPGKDDFPIGLTSLNDFIQHRTPDSPVRVNFLEPGDEFRDEAEEYIQSLFARTYRARIQQFMPLIMSLYDIDTCILAVLGLRPATDEKLFLEQYLDVPVESELNKVLVAFGAEVKREDIIEVGNLASSHTGGARWLIIALTAYLQGAGYQWTVFTALPALQNSFRRLGLKLIPLTEANLDKLPVECHADWGNYYDGKPHVVAVNVPHAYGVLDRLLRLENTLYTMHRIWRDAYSHGAERLLPATTGSNKSGHQPDY